VTDGKNIIVGTTTGAQIGTSAAAKIGFFGATPIVRRPNAASATDLNSAIALANALRDDLVALGLKAA
jgi:hypothetical protein